MKLRIYLASSWRNTEGIKVIMSCLRQHGFEVDCFCDQEGGRIGFNIADCLEASGHSLDEVDPITALQHPAVVDKFKVAFAEDKKWLDWCNCLIMLMPCGRSAHLEAGYVKGQGKLFYIYWMTEPVRGEFDNMYQFADGMFRLDQLDYLVQALKYQEEISTRIPLDPYFLKIASVVAERSTCQRHRVGAVAVRDKFVLATGYNGAPSGARDCLELGCLRDELKIPSGTKQEICRGVHAEQNVIIQASLHGVSLKGSTVYCTHTPCILCAKMLVNAGIKRFVSAGDYDDRAFERLFREAGIKVEIGGRK